MKNQHEPMLKAFARQFLENSETKPNFSNDAFVDGMLIFNTVLMDKLFDNNTDLKLKAKCKTAEQCGKDLRELIKKYTGLDSHELAKNYGK